MFFLRAYPRPRLRQPRCWTPGSALHLAIVFLAFVVSYSMFASSRLEAALVLSEIQYHPAGGDRELEYLEFQNASDSAIDLSGYTICGGVDFQFPEGFFLEPRARVVVCARASRIRHVYEIDNVLGDWGDGTALDNDGEPIVVCGPNGSEELRVRYSDDADWPAGADGTGHALQLVQAFADPRRGASWGLSTPGGTPGRSGGRYNPPSPVRLNEVQLLGTAPWIELCNPSSDSVATSDLELVIGRTTTLRLGDGMTLAPRSYLRLNLRSLAGDPPPPPPAGARTFIELRHNDGRLVDAANVVQSTNTRSAARVPNSHGQWMPAALTTPGESNRLEFSDSVVIHEIFYHPPTDDVDDEFVELRNRLDTPLDLGGWKFADGIRYTFAEHTTIPAGGYLVIARDPERLRRRYGLEPASVVGPRTVESRESFGSLSDRGERIALVDAHGNLVDEVTYSDDGAWPEWADGGGSSLELIDTRTDNDLAQAWAASDDSAKAEVQEFVYAAPFHGVRPESAELHLHLNDAGICTVDSVEVRRRTESVEPGQILIDAGARWRYAVTARSTDTTAWRWSDFDDAHWPSGAAPLGFGTPGLATALTAARGATTAARFRHVFELSQVPTGALFLEVDYDDGFAAYLNGTPVALQNLRSRSLDSLAPRAERRRRWLPLATDETLLQPGRNVLAVQVHNVDRDSRDLFFSARLVSGTSTTTLGENLLRGGDFEVTDSAEVDQPPAFEWPQVSSSVLWRWQGNHIRSAVSAARPISGERSLRIVASGSGDEGVNRIETTAMSLPFLELDATYQVSLRARWHVGSTVLLSHGAYEGSRPASLAASHRLPVPERLGTPGTRNSVDIELERRSGSANSGPLFGDFHQDPVAPRSGEGVRIRTRVSDPDGIRTVQLLFRREHPFLEADDDVTSLRCVEVEPGIYEANIPPQEDGRRVVYALFAEDRRGATGRFPRDARRRTHAFLFSSEAESSADQRFVIYRQGGSSTETLTYAAWLDAETEAYLDRRPVLSNDAVAATCVIAENGRVDDEAGDDETGDDERGHILTPWASLRFSGSPFARQRWQGSYRLRLPRMDSLHGRMRSFNLEEHQGEGGRDGRERVANAIFRAMGVPHRDLRSVRFSLNDRLHDAWRQHVEVPNRDFLRRWFKLTSGAKLYELDDRHQFDDEGRRVQSQDARLDYPPYGSLSVADSPEEYRYFFAPRGRDPDDDHDALIRLAELWSPTKTPNVEFDAAVDAEIDVDAFCRAWAVRLNIDDWDGWGGRRGKNAYLFRAGASSPWHVLPWDQELTFADPTSFLPPAQNDRAAVRYPNAFPEVERFLNRPTVARTFYKALSELLDGPFEPGALAPFLERLEREGMTGAEFGAPDGFIAERRRRLSNVVASVSAQTVSFRLEAAELKHDPTTNSLRVFLSGRAPIEVSALRILVDGTEGAEFRVRLGDASPARLERGWEDRAEGRGGWSAGPNAHSDRRTRCGRLDARGDRENLGRYDAVSSRATRIATDA